MFTSILVACIIAVLLIMCGYLFLSNIKHKKDLAVLSIAMEGNIKIYKELFKLYSMLQENQILHTKGFESVIKQQQAYSKEFQDFKQQVSDAFVIITEFFEASGGSTTVNSLLKAKNDKIKPN